ncbi:MAG: DUF5060 domain-containing protein [Candidatus Sumerlaeia bacterium]|nr:DUF5060 domain-containing protein [Candidatus Sumerlaeia bacterium]
MSRFRFPHVAWLFVCLLSHGRVWPAAPSIAVEAGAERVGLHEKIEFSLAAPIPEGNPFDPDHTALDLEITAPSGKRIRLPAFYYQPFERKTMGEGRRQQDWLYPVGLPVWKARFAPMEIGRHSAVAVLHGAAGEARSKPVVFECTPSANKGHVRVARANPRYFCLDDGSPFFAIGQNVAFIKSLSESEGIFRKMAAQGANYVRVWASCEDWGMCFEGRKNGWTRTWNWKPPVADDPQPPSGAPAAKCVRIAGDKNASAEFVPTAPMALRAGTRYRLTGRYLTADGAGITVDMGGRDPLNLPAAPQWADFRHEFVTAPNQWWLQRTAVRLTGKGAAYLRDLSLREADGGPEILWEADVNRPVIGFYHPADCFVFDQLLECAEKEGIRIQLCLLTRDLYMDRLKDETSAVYGRAIADAKRLFRYAIARWGYSTSIAAWEYWNEMDPGRPTDRFYREMGEYLEQNDPYRHLRGTSNWGPAPRAYRHPKLDTADLHYYMRPTTGDLFKDAVESVRQQAAWLLKNSPPKPALLGEFGLADDKFMRSNYGNDDAEYVHLHQALWASAMSGLAGTALPWWWEEIERRNQYHHYRPLAGFVAGIPFGDADLQAAKATVTNPQAGVMGLQAKSAAWLWFYNTEATWWKLVVERAAPKPVGSATLTVSDLADGPYRVQWWDCWKGEIADESQATATGGRLSLKVPDFARDLACRIIK